MGLPLKKTDRHYTYADYKTWPDDERWELIDGVAWNMSPAPSANHQALSIDLSSRVFTYHRSTPCRVFAAPFDVLLPAQGEEDEDAVSSVVQPDLVVICDPSKLTPRGCFGPPDWAVEILSPYTALKDLNHKKALYERSGILEYWLFDVGNRCLYVYVRGEDDLYGEPEIHLDDATVTPKRCDGPELPLRELFDGARIG
jgi:Uma2 family endonuclease